MFFRDSEVFYSSGEACEWLNRSHSYYCIVMTAPNQFYLLFKTDDERLYHSHDIEIAPDGLFARLLNESYQMPQFTLPARSSELALAMLSEHNQSQFRLVKATLHALLNRNDSLASLAHELEQGYKVFLQSSPASIDNAATLESKLLEYIEVAAILLASVDVFLSRLEGFMLSEEILEADPIREFRLQQMRNMRAEKYAHKEYLKAALEEALTYLHRIQLSPNYIAMRQALQGFEAHADHDMLFEYGSSHTSDDLCQHHTDGEYSNNPLRHSTGSLPNVSRNDLDFIPPISFRDLEHHPFFLPPGAAHPTTSKGIATTQVNYLKPMQ